MNIKNDLQTIAFQDWIRRMEEGRRGLEQQRLMERKYMEESFTREKQRLISGFLPKIKDDQRED